MDYFLSKGMSWKINKTFKSEIDILIDDVIHSEMDLFIVLDGEEGSGKSWAARGLACYIQSRLYENGIEKDFTPENIHFRQKEYLEASKKGEEFDIIVLDEGRSSLGRGKDKATKEACDWVSQCRFMRQFHIICVPAYHDLNPYISEWRMRACIHFKKSYFKNAAGEFVMRHGEYKLYCDLEGLRFHSRFRDYKYPNNYDAWSYWSAKEVFNDEDLKHYNVKKEFFARLEEDSEIQKFSFSEKSKKSISDVARDVIHTYQEGLQ